MMNRPDVVTDEHLVYLNGLRDGGETNMWGAAAYFVRQFPALSVTEAGAVLSYWMDSFAERQDEKSKRG